MRTFRTSKGQQQFDPWRMAIPEMKDTEPTFAVADHVNVEIGDERLWLLVRRCDDERRLVFGTLESKPVDDCGGALVPGSDLVVSFSQIREHERRGFTPVQPF